MKRIITTAALTMLLTVSMMAAGNTSNLEKNRELVAREINRNITCPVFVVENNADSDVKAIIKVTAEGRIEVLEVNASSKELKDYVTEALNKMKFEKSMYTEKFVLVIKFRVV